MPRGRRPVVALAEAVMIAKKRGDTRRFMYEPDMICNFVIYCACLVAHVRIKRVRRLRSTIPWIEREAADAIATLRSIASGPGISRELWIFLPRGSFRFFRVTDTGLIELDRDGSVLVVREKTGPAAVPPASAATNPVIPPVVPDPTPVQESSIGEISSKNSPE